MSSSANGRSPCSSSHSTTASEYKIAAAVELVAACARGPDCRLRAARATCRPGCRRNRPPGVAPSSCEQKLMLKSASLGEPSADSSTLAGFTSRCSMPCLWAWSRAWASCTPRRQTVSGQAAAASRAPPAANRSPPIRAGSFARLASTAVDQQSPVRAAGGVSRTQLDDLGQRAAGCILHVEQPHASAPAAAAGRRRG